MMTIEVSSIAECDQEALIEALDRQAGEYVAATMPQVFEMVGRTSEAAGTSLNTGGRRAFLHIARVPAFRLTGAPERRNFGAFPRGSEGAIFVMGRRSTITGRRELPGC
jgi:hypothetical protein